MEKARKDFQKVSQLVVLIHAKEISKRNKINEVKENLTLFLEASNEGIPSKTRRTTADGIVVNNLTTCVNTASARTRILALGVNAGLVLWAIRTDSALRSACRRGADITGLT